jgi:uncharacterized membrane protein
MLGFALARFMYLHVPTLEKNQAPGEGYYMSKSPYRPALLIHLASVLPAGILAILQFVPQIRYKALIVHRVMGYVSLFLLTMGAATGFILGRRSFGGEISTQTGVVFLGAMTLISAGLAYYNIKRLQIDQHRKWMLRTWFYAGSIITLRLVMIIIAQIISAINEYHSVRSPAFGLVSYPTDIRTQVWSCNEVEYVLKNTTLIAAQYPTCASGQEGGFVVVPAMWTTALSIGSALRVSFGPALWIALLTHAVG